MQSGVLACCLDVIVHTELDSAAVAVLCKPTPETLQLSHRARGIDRLALRQCCLARPCYRAGAAGHRGLMGTRKANSAELSSFETSPQPQGDATQAGWGDWQGTSNNKEHRADTRGSALIVNREGEGRKGVSEGWGTPKTRLGVGGGGWQVNTPAGGKHAERRRANASEWFDISMAPDLVPDHF